MKIFRLLTLAVMLAASSAFAQSPPQNPAMTYKQVPTTGQWINWFTQKQDTLGFTPLNKAGGVLTGKLTTVPSTTNNAGFNVPPGVAPLTPSDGDIWTTTTGMFVQVNGSTVGPFNLAPANPTATAGAAAINGIAPTFMRSDGAPAVAQGTNATKGIVRGDTTSINCTAGVCSAVSQYPTPTRAGDILYWNGSAWVTIAGNNSGTGILAENASGVPSWFKPATLQSAVLGNQSTTSATAVMGGFGSSCAITPTLTGRVFVAFTGWGSINTSTASLNYQLRYGTGTAPTAGAAASGTTVGGLIIINLTPPSVGTVSANGVITGLTAGTAYWMDLSYFVGANTGTLGQISCNAHEF